MELVYLWVEDYKNIKNQGFNFSPRFDCKYDKDSKELTIDENKDYVSIFPDNINVTAIVGENGSGKSSISEILSIFDEKQDIAKCFILMFYNNQIKIKQRFSNKYNNITITNNSLYKIDDTYMKKINFNYFDENKHNSLSKNFFNVLKEDTKIFNYIDVDFIFNYYNCEIDLHKIEYIFNSLFSNLIQLNGKVKNMIDKKIYKELFSKEYNHYISTKPNTTTLFYRYLILIRLLENTSIENKKLDKLILEIKDIFNKSDFKEYDYIKINRSINSYYKRNEHYDIKNIRELLKDITFKKDAIWVEKEVYKVNSDSFHVNEHIGNIFSEYSNFNFYNNKNQNYNYQSLSTGEKKYLNLFTEFIHKLKNMKDTYLTLFFDEPDALLHPKWQKNVIEIFVQYANKFLGKKRIHLILTTHSPFILSDLPKENIIFLEKGIQKEILKENEQTFGANIHTLLSHSFFMEAGLMGEFAKGKIEEIKKFYEVIKKLEKRILSSNKTKKLAKKSFEKRKKRFKHIQSIIGEPFLQTVIKNYLDELEIIFNGKKQFLQDEIKRLQELESSL